LGKHFFLNFSYLSGVRTDYLAPTIYFIDLVFTVLFFINLKKIGFLFFEKKFWLFSFFLLINLFFSLNRWLTFYSLLRIYQLVFIYFIFKKNPVDKKNLLLAIFLATLFQSLLVFLQLINHGSIQGIFYFFGERFYYGGLPGIAKVFFNGKEVVRPYGTFSHPNSLAGFYLLLYFFFIQTNWGKKFFLIKNLLRFLFLFLIFFSFSKTAITVFFLLNLFYLIKKAGCRLCLFGQLMIFFILTIVFLGFGGDLLSLKNRLFLINRAMLIIKQSPVFGVGLGNYLVAQNKINWGDYYSPVFNQPVHNIFLLFFSQVGIVSLFLFFLIKKNLGVMIKRGPYLFWVIFLTGLTDHYWLTLIQNQLLLAVLFAFL